MVTYIGPVSKCRSMSMSTPFGFRTQFCSVFDPSLQQNLDQKCLCEKMTTRSVGVLKSSLLPSSIHLQSPLPFFLFFVLFLLQSSIKFRSKTKQMLLVRASRAASTAAVHSTCVIITSSGRTFASSTIVLHFIFSVLFLNSICNLNHKS